MSASGNTPTNPFAPVASLFDRAPVASLFDRAPVASHFGTIEEAELAEAQMAAEQMESDYPSYDAEDVERKKRQDALEKAEYEARKRERTRAEARKIREEMLRTKGMEPAERMHAIHAARPTQQTEHHAELHDLANPEPIFTHDFIEINDFVDHVRPSLAPTDAKCGICEKSGFNESVFDTKLRNCKHLFHYGCLTRAVNETAENSNKCPICGTIICRQRKADLPAEDLA